MNNKKALFIGHWEKENGPSASKTHGLSQKFVRTFGDKLSYNFASLDGNNSIPTVLKNPKRSELTVEFEKAENLASESDLLLIYYVGHGAIGANNEIKIR